MIFPDLKRGYLFPKLINRHGFRRGAEIGVLRGHFSSVLLAKSDLSLLVSIDIWPKKVVLEDAIDRLSQFGERSCLIKASSEKASQLFADGFFDFVYIDADHAYSSIKRDLECWWPKVRAGGGMISGHNYQVFEDYGVIEAVNELGLAHGVEIHTCEAVERSWYCFKEKP